jgi:hypothetical protein
MLRLTMLAIVACSPAGAEPVAAEPVAAEPASRVHPAGWRQLPAIRAAVSAAAKADGITVDAADAWGEPRMGCYAVWLDVHGDAADAAALADQVLGSAAVLSPSDVAKPSGPDGMLGFSFASPPYRGRVRAQLGAGRISAVACFGNQREPVTCDTACNRVLRAP